MKILCYILFIIINFTACSFNMDSITNPLENIFSNEYIELDDSPEDSIMFSCDDKKYFYLRRSDNQNSVWVIYPKQEIRLVQEGDDNIYSNGFTTLHYSLKNTFIKDESGILYNNCFKK